MEIYLLTRRPDSEGLISDYGYLTQGQHVIELAGDRFLRQMTKEQIILQVGAENLLRRDLLSPESRFVRCRWRERHF